MGRISRQVMFMEMARAASRRSTCFRLNVGAMIVHDNNPVAAGWNGQEPGAPHCAGNDCPGVVPGHCDTIHAEVNALIKAEMLLGAGSVADLYVTNSPCNSCVSRIMESTLRVERLFFEVPYRKTEHLERFRAWTWPETIRHTAVYEITPAGYIVDHFSRQVVELP